MQHRTSGLFAPVFATLLLAACAASGPAEVATSAAADDGAIVQFSSTTVIIEGVPFVRFSEAYRFDYPDSNIVNPSVPASWAMVYKFFGQRLSALRNYSPKNWIQDGGEDADLDDLKRYIDRGIPVNVRAASTPYAHVIGLAQFITATTGQSGPIRSVSKDFSTQILRAYNKGSDRGPNSGVLGPMEPFSTFQQVGRQST